MKKLCSIIFPVLLVVSCVREDIGDVTSPVERYVPVSFRTLAPDAAGLADTRTMLNPDYSVSWHSDDAVAYVSFENPVRLENTFSSGPIAVFEGDVPEKSLVEQEQFLVYPYRETDRGEAMMRKRLTSGIDGTYVIENIVLPQRQQMVKDSFGQGYNISAAAFSWGDDSSVRFTNLSTLFKVSLKGNAVVKEIAFSSGGPLCGTFQLNYKGPEWEQGKEFELQFQPDLHGNPTLMDRVFLESENGLQLTEEPQSFYFTVFHLPSMTYAGDRWKLTVTTVEGDVFEPELNTVNVYHNAKPSKVTDWGEYTVNGNPFDLQKVICDKKPRGIHIVRTRYLDYEYDVRASDSWFSVAKEETGFRLEFSENDTGEVREGSVEVISDGQVKTLVPVRQTESGYRDLLGPYVVDNAELSTLVYLKEAGNGQEDHYVLEASEQDLVYLTDYTLKFNIIYNGIGRSLLSLPLPQKLDEYNGGRTDYIGRIPELTGATDDNASYGSVLCSGEGIGFDLEYTRSGAMHLLELVPNTFALGRYNEMNTLFVTLDGMALEKWGENLILFSVPDSYEGSHDGYTPKN